MHLKEHSARTDQIFVTFLVYYRVNCGASFFLSLACLNDPDGGDCRNSQDKRLNPKPDGFAEPPEWLGDVPRTHFLIIPTFANAGRHDPSSACKYTAPQTIRASRMPNFDCS